jgi:membrane protease YdiL (CAAX protease family)
VVRLAAIIEIVACSGFPTQILLIVALRLAHVEPFDGGGLSITFVAALSFLDAGLVIGLCFFFLWMHRESPRAVFLGRRPFLGDALLGVALVPAIFFFVVLLLLLVVTFAPWLHNVPKNPLESLLQTPGGAWIFAGVAVVAGGLREELQRAFILHRFDGYLGGAELGVILWSVVFGLGHLHQGYDAVIATGCLGAIWGLVYLRRRSVVAPIVSHAGFNLTEIGSHLLLR